MELVNCERRGNESSNIILWSVNACGLVEIVVSENLAASIAMIVDAGSMVLPNIGKCT
jgi:hypothetical protein